MSKCKRFAKGPVMDANAFLMVLSQSDDDDPGMTISPTQRIKIRPLTKVRAIPSTNPSLLNQNSIGKINYFFYKTHIDEVRLG